MENYSKKVLVSRARSSRANRRRARSSKRLESSTVLHDITCINATKTTVLSVFSVS